MSSSQLMSWPGVAATRSTSSTMAMSSWYGKRLPDRYSASIEKIFSGSALRTGRASAEGDSTVAGPSTERTGSAGAGPPASRPAGGSTGVSLAVWEGAGSARTGPSVICDRLALGQPVDGVLEVAVEHRLDLVERPLLGHAGYVARAGERHPRHRRGLGGERREVLGLERVHVRLPARAREHLDLERERVEEVEDPVRRLVHVQALAELWVLRRDPDRAAAGVAVVALSRGHADRALVVGDARDLLVAVERHQRRVADRDRLRAEREALGDVA